MWQLQGFGRPAIFGVQVLSAFTGLGQKHLFRRAGYESPIRRREAVWSSWRKLRRLQFKARRSGEALGWYRSEAGGRYVLLYKFLFLLFCLLIRRPLFKFNPNPPGNIWTLGTIRPLKTSNEKTVPWTRWIFRYVSTMIIHQFEKKWTCGEARKRAFKASKLQQLSNVRQIHDPIYIFNVKIADIQIIFSGPEYPSRPFFVQLLKDGFRQHLRSQKQNSPVVKFHVPCSIGGKRNLFGRQGILRHYCGLPCI